MRFFTSYFAQTSLYYSERFFSAPVRALGSRIRYHYSENYTGALVLPITDEELIAAHASPIKLLELSRENIRLHAKFRVDLFFYLLVAYYKTGLTPQLAPTVLQFGRGRHLHGKTMTQGCHSSLIPSLIDQNTLSPPQKCILSNTHFMNSLNMTVELPSWVNTWLDNRLEQNLQCRKNALKVLCHTAADEMNPIDGLEKLLHLLDQAFNQIETRLSHKENLPLVVQKSLLELTRQGTFENHWDDKKQKLNNDYIESLLMLTPFQKQQTQNSKQKLNIWHQKMSELQQEILSSKVNLDHPAVYKDRILNARDKNSGPNKTPRNLHPGASVGQLI
ncbi:MAG: hypothetical protein SFW66_02670 [Gammaproteobacteria bacterium]|nr:hypothetical protein [Gammaproteobacteria bacterium]